MVWCWLGFLGQEALPSLRQPSLLFGNGTVSRIYWIGMEGYFPEYNRYSIKH